MKLRNAQWEKLEPLMTGKVGDSGARARNNRLFIEAVLWVSAGHRLWHDLPTRFGRWNTTYMRFVRWNKNAVWRRLAAQTRDDRELCAMLEHIAAYGDAWSMRIAHRSQRADSRDSFAAAMQHVGGPKPVLSTEDDSTLHWLRLVNE
ncbi:transposase [Collimonas sp. H4R21]|uniref:Transposase n=1 Tax=Collimonas rhizosphaerae TaxID=3126357 RepID=A0ABU9Q183_9BURK